MLDACTKICIYDFTFIFMHITYTTILLGKTFQYKN